MTTLIGIGGPSRAGKTTLARLLAEDFEDQGFSVSALHQDECVVEEKELPFIYGKRDWEVPESIDWVRWHRSIEKACESHEVVIAEGLHCFYKEEIVLYDYKIYVNISKSLFVKRKEVDVRWGGAPEPDWYIRYIWQSYLRYKNPLILEPDVLQLDGSKYFDITSILSKLNIKK